jgi:hypothetical protein
MFLLGSFFDTDPWVPWAGHILRDAAVNGPETRVKLLYDKMLWFRETVTGTERELEQQALLACHDLLIDAFEPEDPRFASAWIAALWRIHPRRAAYVGEVELLALLHVATKNARRHGVGTSRGVCLWAFLMLTRGHRFADDPLGPWAPEALEEHAGDTVTQRTGRLEAEFDRYRTQVLALREEAEMAMNTMFEDRRDR